MAALLRSAEESLHNGELAQAEASAREGLKMANSSGDRFLEWKCRLLLCQAMFRNRTPTEVLSELQKPMPEGAEYRALAARQKMIEGDALLALGRSAESGKAFEAAYSLALEAGSNETLSDIELRAGSQLLQRSQYDAAEQKLRLALKRAEDGRLPFQAAGALVNLGMSRVDRHHYDEAIPYFQRASMESASESRTLHGVAEANLATCYYSLGEFDKAIEIQLAVIAEHERTGAKLYLERVLGEIGHAYQLKGDRKQAAHYLERALTIANEIGRGRDAAIWAGNLASLYGELEEWDKAESFNTEAIRLKRSLGSKTLVYNSLNTARIAIGRGRRAEGETLYRTVLSSNDDPAVLWEVHSELGRIARLAGETRTAVKEYEAAVNIVEQTRSELLKTDYKLSFLTRLIRLYQGYVDTLLEQGEFNRALAVADSSRAQALADRYGAAPARRLDPNVFSRISQRTGATIFAYWLGPKDSHAWAVTPDGLHHAVLASQPEIAKLAEEYNDAIQKRLADPRRTRIPAGERLFELLIAPLQQWAPAGKPVLIVPDGVLSSINFETLPVPGTTPARYWVEDISIAIAPSISVIGGTEKASSQGGSTRAGLLLIGDPDRTDPDYPPLTHAAEEITGIARHYDPNGRMVLQRVDASASAYKAANPSRFDAIHFAAHAIASRESPLDSAVLLSGSKLYAREVLESPLHATLVTISACRGLGARNYVGEGLVGFAWAFLRAGARNVVAGLWDVNDQSTSLLMDSLYRELASGQKPAAALRTAKLTLIRSRSNFQKPYYWGPFQAYTVDSRPFSK